MPRGQASQVGDTMINANGYHNTRTEDGWRLTHHLIAEEILGRPLANNEQVRFKGSKRDLSPENIQIVTVGTGSIRRRIAHIEVRIAELEAERDELRRQLSEASSSSK